jgi:hypothetical protein
VNNFLDNFKRIIDDPQVIELISARDTLYSVAPGKEAEFVQVEDESDFAWALFETQSPSGTFSFMIRANMGSGSGKKRAMITA